MTKKRHKQKQAVAQSVVSSPDSSSPVPGDFSRPHDVDGMTVVFGGRDEVFRLMPRYEEIPEEFRHDRTPFNRVQSEWFFDGLKQWPLTPKPGIDFRKAQAHLAAIQRSFAPPHEHKAAGVAYLMSLWFEPPKEG